MTERTDPRLELSFQTDLTEVLNDDIWSEILSGVNLGTRQPIFDSTDYLQQILLDVSKYKGYLRAKGERVTTKEFLIELWLVGYDTIIANIDELKHGDIVIAKDQEDSYYMKPGTGLALYFDPVTGIKELVKLIPSYSDKFRIPKEITYFIADPEEFYESLGYEISPFTSQELRDKKTEIYNNFFGDKMVSLKDAENVLLHESLTN